MKIEFSDVFDHFQNDERSWVFQMFPDCHKDNRGYFMEVFKETNDEAVKIPAWTRNSNWIRQINRSSSSGGVIRGCHAQRGMFCQGKLVEAVNERIYDIITDTRPDSGTFGSSSVFLLDPEKHNRLWVPRGFLHAFIVPFSVEKQAIFEYYCDNVYNHYSEVGVNPTTILPKVVESFRTLMSDSQEDLWDMYEIFDKKDSCVYSEKDMNGLDYEKFISDVQKEYGVNGSLWYR